MSKEPVNIHLGTLEECYTNNIKLIHKVCNRFRHRARSNGMEYGDIFGLACIGFTKAYERFDPKKLIQEIGKDVKFATYCVPMMVGEILREIRDTNEGLKFSRSDKAIARKIIEFDLVDKSSEYVSELLGVSKKAAVGGFDCLLFGQTKSLYEPTYSSSDGDDDITVEDQTGVSQDESALFVDDFLCRLTNRQRFVVEEYMKGKTQKEIGKSLNVAQVQVSRIIKRVRQLYQDYSDGLPLEYKQSEIRELSRGVDKSLEKKKEKLRTTNDEARRLLKETDMSINEIAEKTGANMNSLRTWAYKIRKTTKDPIKKNERLNSPKLKSKENNNPDLITLDMVFDKDDKLEETTIEKKQNDMLVSIVTSGDCKTNDDFMNQIAKVCEMLNSYGLRDFSFQLQIKN